MRSLSPASSAASGSSSRRSLGPLTSALPRATRWRSPPDKVSGRAVEQVADLERVDDGGFRDRAVSAVAPETEVLPDVEMREQQRVLGHVANSARLGGKRDPVARREQRVAVDPDLSAIGSSQSRDRLEERGLARPGRSEQGRHRQVEVERYVERQGVERQTDLRLDHRGALDRRESRSETAIAASATSTVTAARR